MLTFCLQDPRVLARQLEQATKGLKEALNFLPSANFILEERNERNTAGRRIGGQASWKRLEATEKGVRTFPAYFDDPPFPASISTATVDAQVFTMVHELFHLNGRWPDLAYDYAQSINLSASAWIHTTRNPENYAFFIFEVTDGLW